VFSLFLAIEILPPLEE